MFMLWSRRIGRAVSLVLCAVPLFWAASTRAEITYSGDVSPANPYTWTANTTGYIGYDSAGTIIVSGNSTLLSQYGNLGNNPGSTGNVTVTGNGSTWVNNRFLNVGNLGIGNLTIANGGMVTNNTCKIGGGPGSTGFVTVIGNGSTLTNTSGLTIGGGTSSGCLTIANEGKVTSPYLSINSLSSSVVNLHVSGNNMLMLGDTQTTGVITNNGKINLYANTFLSAGVYTPISEYAGRTINWSGNGTYNAFGGTWDSIAKTFTVPDVTPLAAGVAGNLTAGERLVISGSGQQVGVSFGAGVDGKTFSADLMTPAQIASLQALLPGDQTVLSGWNFTTNLTGNTVLLSYDLGLGASSLGVWHYDGAAWTSFAASDLIYSSDGLASFTVSGFSGYALTGVPVPEPATLALVGLGLLALTRRRRRKHRLADA